MGENEIASPLIRSPLVASAVSVVAPGTLTVSTFRAETRRDPGAGVVDDMGAILGQFSPFVLEDGTKPNIRNALRRVEYDDFEPTEVDSVQVARELDPLFKQGERLSLTPRS